MTSTQEQKFLIGPIKDGIRTDIKPWAIPEDSFVNLFNMYQFRGRLVRRKGYKLLGTLADGNPVMGLKTYEGYNVNIQTLVAFSTTTSYSFNGTSFVVLPSIMPVTWSGTNSQFFFTTNYADAFWATNFKPGLHGINISNAVAGVGITTITTSSPHGFTTGQSVAIININPATTSDINGDVYVITVTGATTFTIPFQTANAYTSGGIALNSAVSITGQDGIRYYGDLTNGTGWANYNPPINPNNALAGALMIFPYRGYLVFLNTWEGNETSGVVNYGNRARWTQIGTPYYSSPAPILPGVQGIDSKTARDDLFGRGGANDAPTNEVIVSAQFIRDVLVVFFERSTWRLRFVNNAQNPFVWERVNIELGASCTFSAIPFDKGLMAIGDRGIVISDGNDTIRIDDKIPDTIFEIRASDNGFQRVQGIRTFKTKLNYWTYPSSDYPTGIYPDYVLVFNYDTKNWSFYDDTFTTFGYYYPAIGSAPVRWQDLPNAWATYTDVTWQSGDSQPGEENIVAGNQQGFVFQLEVNGNENSPSLNITATTPGSPGIFTSANHNLKDGDWITLTGMTGTTDINGVSLNGRNFKLSDATGNANTFQLLQFAPIDGFTATGTTYTNTINYQNLVAGSIQINIGSLVFTDPMANGNLKEASSLGSGTINYSTGALSLTFNPAIATTQVWIFIVSYDPLQGGAASVVNTVGAYTGGGQITKISNIYIQSKFFNFFPQDQKARIMKIDMYVNSTVLGQFQCDVFADSSNEPINTPLSDNPLQNVVLTSSNPYQVGQGDQAIYRLYLNCVSQTTQLQFTMNDQQMATDLINRSDIEIVAMMVTARPAGRII